MPGYDRGAPKDEKVLLLPLMGEGWDEGGPHLGPLPLRSEDVLMALCFHTPDKRSGQQKTRPLKGREFPAVPPSLSPGTIEGPLCCDNGATVRPYLPGTSGFRPKAPVQCWSHRTPIGEALSEGEFTSTPGFPPPRLSVWRYPLLLPINAFLCFQANTRFRGQSRQRARAPMIPAAGRQPPSWRPRRPPLAL